jgi:hypothetical protein
MFNTPVPGGAFKGPAQMGTFTHNHASQMAHVAASRAKIAKALSVQPPPGGMQPVAPVGPVGAVPPIAPPPPGGNFKAHIAHAVTMKTGKPVTLGMVHGAIDRLQQKGRFTPFQAASLKQHNGPLMGAPGQSTMGSIANEVASGPPAQPGMM